MKTFLATISAQEIARAIAPRKDISKGVKTNKPNEGGLIAYVWRQVRFNAGIDVSMPVMAIFDLADYAKTLPNFTENWSGALIPRDSQAKDLLDEANALADEVTTILGYDKYAGVRVWSKVL